MDIVPSEAEAYELDTTTNVTWGILSGSATELCTEWWTLDYPRMACVAWYQEFTRNLDTADTTDDIVISTTSAFVMTAFAGVPTTTSVIFFPEETVDFADWADSPVDLHGVALACSVSVAMVLGAILF